MNKAEKKKKCLDYEIYMFREVCNRFKKNKDNDRFLKNSLVELLALHTRVLVDFFYNNGRKDDIIAQDFFSNMDWNTKRPQITDILDKAKNKADKQLVHLTKERIRLIKNRENSWKVSEIERDMNLVIEIFEECFKKEDYN